MADLSSLLTVLEHDPDDIQALEALVGAARTTPPDLRATRFATARKVLGGRGRPDAVVQLIDAELATTGDVDRKVDLLLEKGMVLDGDLLDVPAARTAFVEVTKLRADDSMAKEALGELEVAQQNWKKFAAKYIAEATGSTDRSLATGLFVSAAEAYVRFAPDAPEAEQYLLKALEVDPRNGKAAFHLARLYRRRRRFTDLAALLEQRGDHAPTVEEKVSSLLALAEVARTQLNTPHVAEDAMKKVLALDPAQPQALRGVTDRAAAAGNWREVVAAYQNALKARRNGEDVGMMLQIAMVLWKHVGDLDAAEEWFRRIRKTEASHPAAIDFYREFYPAKGDSAKLLNLLKAVEKAVPASEAPRGDSDRAKLTVEIAELAEAQNNPEKAIEAWKQYLRQDPQSLQARAALTRLYRKTEKWNALLDLLKDEGERIPETDVAARVAKLHEVVEIYRDKLRLDVMVINTYNAILKFDPENRRANDELAGKFRQLGRWNDLIAVLTRKSESTELPLDERVALLREIADLWSDRFGNFANAIKPLERILEIAPTRSDDLGNATTRLKEIYTKRRQWRQLIEVLGREASALDDTERRAKQAEMARLAAERLGDTRLAIEIYNGILGEAGAADLGETFTALAALYEREKRYHAVAEILHRQAGQATGKDAIAVLERLGAIYADRLAAPQLAADQWQRVLDIEPGHAKGLRTLRELYATAGDFAGLEKLYAKLGQEDELVDALLAIADRIEQKQARLPIVERAAQLAQQRADAKAGDAASLERARQVWERVLSVEALHQGAAQALAPIYAKQEKWARLIAVHEIEVQHLAAVGDVSARLAKIAQIRTVAEQKLASRTLGFAWTIKAFDLDPASPALFDDVLRLAQEPEQWREVVAAFERAQVAGETKLRLVRELAKIASKRLGDPEKARAYHRQILGLAPDDRAAEQALEELAIQLTDWPELLASYRRRAAREPDPMERAGLLIDIASLQEEKLVDLDGAAATYHEALAAVPGQLRALRAVARIEEARGDWDALARVLGDELAQTHDGQARFDLLMRLGQLEETSLEHADKALAHFREALAVPASGGGVRPQAITALTRYLAPKGPGTKVPPLERVAAARLLLPHLEASRQLANEATALEVIRQGSETSPVERLEIDRALMRIYHTELGDPAAAWEAGRRVLGADPVDVEVRASLSVLAGQLGRDGEWMRELGAALASVKAKGGAPGEIRTLATELAKVAGERLADKTTAERAWMTVLEVESDASDAFDALIATYRADQRWTDLRALLARRTDVSIDDGVRLASLLELATLEEDVLGQAANAAAAHRRVLEIDPGHHKSYQALDRLYTTSEQWPQLEELLARQVDQGGTVPQQIELSYRRAALFAHRLGDPVRAVDLLEDVIGKQRGHADARELLEELLTQPGVKPDVTMRIARLLEPLYEQDKLWRDLVNVLRVQRKLVVGTEAVEVLSRIATIEEAELAGARNAFEAWIEVLGLDPTHERARIELSRLATALDRWREATVAFETAASAAPAGDLATRAALLGELATYYDSHGDAAQAITAYRRLLDADPTNPVSVRRATTSLARLYEDAKNWPELRAVTRRLSEWAEDVGERRTLLARVATLEEQRLDDRTAAIATWRDVLGDLPGDVGALNALERLYQAAEKWRELIDVLRAKLEVATPHDAKTLLARIAEIHEVALAEPDDAIAAHLEILERDGEDRNALSELARLYRESSRHVDLLEVVERQAQLAEGDAQIELSVQIAKLLSGPLSRPVEALDRWRDVLHVEPTHPEALAAIEGALSDLDLRTTAAEMLRPVYEATGQDARLAALSLKTAEWTDEPAQKMRALAEVVRLREHRLDDKPGAFKAQLEMLVHAAAEPELAQVVAETERLAGELGREGDLIDTYREVAPNVLDAEIQRRLYLDVADLSRAVRRDHVVAREYYQKVLDSQPDDRRALAALESIYRETEDDEHLTDVLLRQADVSAADVDDRVTALVEAAGLYVKLARPDDAISTWEQVLQLAPERGDAAYALEALYSQQGRWPDVVDLCERRLGFVTSIDEAVALRVQLGEIHEKRLHDIETAVDNYAAALSGNPRHQGALVAVERYLDDPDVRALAAEVLEPIYVAQHRWTDLVRVYEAKLGGASDPRDRLRLTRFVARLYEEQLEDFENASHWYARVFREAPADPTSRDQLQRLASVVGNWAFVAETYQSFLDDESGESPEAREIAIAAATIYDRRLDSSDQAFAAYRRALAIPAEGVIPDERELIRRVEELLSRARKPAELVLVYDDVIARGDDDLRREALVKRARLVESGLGELGRAIDGWREVVLAVDGAGTPVGEAAYREAVGELERLYRSRKQWRDLVELLESRLARSAEAQETAELRLRLADLHETELADIGAALDQYEHVIAEHRLWDRAVAALERLVVHESQRERIVELLEPVYRDQDWWQKLVVILDAKLAFIHDPLDQILTLHEIAEIHENRGGALDLALEALARAWRIDVAEDDSLAKLLSLAGKLEAWDEVVRTLEDGAANAPSAEMSAGLWSRAAEIHESRRNDNLHAIAAWRKVEEARPDDMIALAALDRLLALEGRVPELVQVVARRAELSEDGGVRLVLLHRVAALYEDVLGDKPHAIEAYKSVLGVDDTDISALDSLERLYRDAGDGRELAETLERKIELTADVATRQGLRHAAAQVYETQLVDIYQAIGQLTAVLDDDAGEPSALGELDRIYAKEKMWPELLDIVDRRALLAIASKDRADLAHRAAQLVERELVDPDAAIPRYGAVLQVLPAHQPARAALEALMAQDEHVAATSALLERVYRADRDAAGLVRVYERRLAIPSDDPAARRADWTALADVHETIEARPENAFAVWARAIAAEPEEIDLLQPLLRLAEARPALWQELANQLDGLLRGALPPEAEQAYAMRLGQIAEDRLGALDRAAAAFERASHGPEPRSALAALERVLARSGRSQELATTLRRQADSAEDDAQIGEYLYRLGDLQETTLHDLTAAVGAYREVLQLLPEHHGARAALERMLAGDLPASLRRDIVDVLEPLFEQDGDYARLASVLDWRFAITEDPIDRANLLARQVEIAEDKLNDRARALDGALRWLAVDPASQQALHEAERLAERLGQWPEVASRVKAIVDAPDAHHRDPEIQVGLLVFLGRIQRERTGQLDLAAASFRAALALEPEALGAMDDLIVILRDQGDAAGLVEVLRHRGRVVQELPEKRAAFAEVALLSERAGDRAGAIAAWREIADQDDNDRGALEELARIYRSTGDRAELIDTLNRAARLAASPVEEKALRVEIAQLDNDGPRAVAGWQAVLDLDPDDPSALSSLEAAHVKAGDWMAVSDIQTRRLSLARSDWDRVAIHAEMARLAETKRNSVDDAIASWFAALDIDASYAPAFAELERLLAAHERWHDLVELLERLAEVYAVKDDSHAEIAALARAADVWEAKLDNPDAAGEILEKILQREPGSVAALTRLSKIYERAGDWDKCKATLNQALKLISSSGPTGREAADLFFRLGEVARVGDSDLDTAIQHFQQALKHDPAHPASIAALEKIARERRDNALLADMLARKVETIAVPADRVALLVEIAELERKANRNDAALAALARASKDAPGDVRILAPLADLYFAAGRLEEAAPIYNQLAEDAKAGRRMKDVARFRQRQGGILEARGDRPGALAAYEEALRVNPTDVTTMSGLGRLYFDAQEWEKARKIYQSLVLQNIDADAGVTKADVYWSLGTIYQRLDQAPKAKSMFQRGLEVEPGNAKLKDALAGVS